MLLAGLFAALASAVRLAQDAAVAWRYGTGPAVDAFYFASSIVNWPVAVTLSALTFMLAPTEAALRSAAPEQAQRFRAELLAWVLVVALVAAPATVSLLQVLVGGPLGGLGLRAAAEVRVWAPVMALAVAAGVLGALFTAWLVARSHALVTLLEGVQPLVLLGAVLLAPGLVLFWGTALGAVVQMLAMASLLWVARALPAPRWGWSGHRWRSFSRGLVLVAAGQVLFAFVPLIDPFFAAPLGEGMVAALGFAGRLVIGLQGLAGLALQRAGLPLLSQLAVSSPTQVRQVTWRWAVGAAAVGVAIGAVVAWWADPLVALVFERGRFSSSDRQWVADLLRYGMLQMPPFLAGLVVVTALAGAHAHRSLAWVSGMGLVAKLVFSAALVGQHGVVGLLIATAMMYACTMALAWWLLTRHLRQAGLPAGPPP